MGFNFRWKLCVATLCTWNILCLINILHWNNFHLSDVTQSKAFVKKIDFSKETELNEIAPKKWTDQSYCKVSCRRRNPCRYVSEADFRLIILSHVGSTSLVNTLASILDLDTLGDRVSLEIWLFDAENMNHFERQVILNTMHEFRGNWTDAMKKGRSCVHIQATHLGDKFVNIWKGRRGSNEIALIISDTVLLSRHAYRWLKSAHGIYENDTNVAGYGLLNKSQILYNHDILNSLKEKRETPGILAGQSNRSNSHSPNVGSESVIIEYAGLSPIAFSPNSKNWHMFQKWYNQLDFKDYIEETPPYEDILTKLPQKVAMFLKAEFESIKSMNKPFWLAWWYLYIQDRDWFTVLPNFGNSSLALTDEYSSLDGTLHRNKGNSNHFWSMLPKWDPDIKLQGQINQTYIDIIGNSCLKQCCFKENCNET